MNRPRTTSRPGAALALAIAPAIAAALAAGCNDGIQCQTSALVLIESPTGAVVDDLDPSTDGVQIDVHVRTTLGAGEPLTLTVLDAGGGVEASAATTAGADGTAVFAGVTVPAGPATLRVQASGACGDAQDEAAIDVVAGQGCVLTLAPAPVDNAYYAPLKVLNAAADPDPVAAGMQATVYVATATGWSTELFVTGPTGQEVSAGTMAAADGTATFPLTLDEGRIGLRAVCSDPSAGTSAASLTTTVLVDTEAPTCAMTAPAPGSTITPAYDQDGNLGNGVQLTLAGTLGGSDVVGEATSFRVIAPDGSQKDLAGTAADAAGATSVDTTLAPATTPATYTVELRGSDHAGNGCTAAHEEYPVVLDGCDIQVTSPTGPVTADVDGNAGNGAQLDATLTVATACAGRTVTSDCGTGTTTATVPADGNLTMRLTACATDPCELTQACTFSVTTVDGVSTSAGLNLVFDDQAPAVSVAVVAPAVACGAQVGPEVDVDPGTAGVQVTARVTSPGAATRQLELTNAGGTSTVDASADVTVTLAAGANTLVGLAADAYGNVGSSPGCGLTLADLAVSFSPPAADGQLSSNDGSVSGKNLTTDICGTVNKTGATVTLAVDGGAALPATVSGTTWCRTVTLAESPPSHTLYAQATAGSSLGSATLVVSVDVTPPGAVTDLAAVADTRRSISLTWTAPADGAGPVAAYVLKYATTTLTDANFDTTGTVVATGQPGAPGAPESSRLDHLHAGTTYWIGIASVDVNGNRAVADIVGPIVPAFDQTGAIVPPDAATSGTVGLGTAIAHGRFNDDAYDDVAVGAASRWTGSVFTAGAVYVYFGGPNGIGTTPDVVIQGSQYNGEVGFALTAIRWSSSTRDDLVIGAPIEDRNAGNVYVFHGGATFPTTGTVAVTGADQRIAVASTSPGWFDRAELGTQLVTGDWDGDGTPDLFVSAPGAGGGTGGVVAILGGTATAATIALSDVDTSGLNGAEVQVIENPGTSKAFGRYLFDVGRTMGASDTTDDLLIGRTDDATTTGDSVWIYRGAGPRSAGLTFRAFTVGVDVRIDRTTADLTTAFGSQAVSVPDVDGNGARDIAIGAWQDGSNDGQVLIVQGNVTGSGGVAATSSPGVVLTSITGAGGQQLGSMIAATAHTGADVDGDGKADLLIGGLAGGVAHFYLWFGGAIPTGSTSTASAGDDIVGPSTFRLTTTGILGPGQAAWVGDVNGDGLDDVCWSSPADNSHDGSFEVLWDNGM